MIQDGICKNCQTNLSTILMLEELPSKITAGLSSKGKKPSLDQLGLGFLILLVGMGVAGLVNSLSFQRQSPIIQVQNQPTIQQSRKKSTSPKPISRKPRQKGCGGFYYTVRSGNSLSLISSRFYGNPSLFKAIIKANPDLRNRENNLYLGEQLFIPNRQESCP